MFQSLEFLSKNFHFPGKNTPLRQERIFRYDMAMNSENLWAPWRMVYLRALERKSRQAHIPAPGSPDPEPCFFSQYWKTPDQDEQNGIVYRDETGIILLNRYPYTNGHLLTALGEPRPTLLDYPTEQRAAFWRLIEIGMALMQHTIEPQGINVGINIGKAAGAGVPEHIHGHLVPRWSGDTNFMTAVGDIRVIPDSLEMMGRAYRSAFDDFDPSAV